MDTYTVFADFRKHVHTGCDLAHAVDLGRRAYTKFGAQTVVVFDNTTGDRTEIDPRPDAEPACAWLRTDSARRAGPGRPKLGVVSREVSLLPRDWEWLGAQPGGASAAIRGLVDEARRSPRHRARGLKDAAYKFLSVVGGDLPNFEEISRALYAGRFEQAVDLLAPWPKDLRQHGTQLLREAESAS